MHLKCNSVTMDLKMSYLGPAITGFGWQWDELAKAGVALRKCQSRLIHGRTRVSSKDGHGIVPRHMIHSCRFMKYRQCPGKLCFHLYGVFLYNYEYVCISGIVLLLRVLIWASIEVDFKMGIWGKEFIWEMIPGYTDKEMIRKDGIGEDPVNGP